MSGSLVSPELLDQIYRVVREVLRTSPDVGSEPPRYRGNPAFIAITTTTISARSGTTPGTGTAEICYLNDSGVYAASDDERTVYNHSTSEIANGSYVLVAMCGGRLEMIANDGSGGLLGKTDSSHAKNASGTVSVWSGTPGSESDSGVDITAYNKFADVASGKFVWVLNNGDGYYLVAAEC